MSTTIAFAADPASALESAEHWYFIGTRPSLEALKPRHAGGVLPDALEPYWRHLCDHLRPGDSAQLTSTLFAPDPANPLAMARVYLLGVSERSSRHNAIGRPDAVLAALRGRFGRGRSAVVLVPDPQKSGDEVLPWVLAIARGEPTWSYRPAPPPASDPRSARPVATRKASDPAEVTIAAVGRDLQAESATLGPWVDAVRRAASLVDMPPNELGVDRFVTECMAVAAAHGVAITIKRQAELVAEGFGGLVAVGKAATQEPALVHLRWDPPETSAPPVAWVGKGIVYDTGGLSLKGKFDMPGMKNDMGGAAAVLAAFDAACRLGLPRRIDAILCLAENAIGPNALKPDDIIQLYSGKSVEINNTDAEGRLVLADGVAFAGRRLEAPIICDLATLTGAQLISTGKIIAAIVSNDEELEAHARNAGRRVGEPVFPLPWAPELFRGEFHSPVADLRNSVKDRANAQSSCAAQFIAESLEHETTRWLHIDLAGPVTSRDRGTGFGVGLLLGLFGPDGGV
jgi:probable aminopeptidase NPEPL1